MTLLLWDLDGTLINSGPVVTSTLKKVLFDVTGVETVEADLMKYIGPPLHETMDEFSVDEAQAEQLTTEYMTAYHERMYETPLFDGVRDVLAQLSERYEMAMATSKNEDNAVLLAEHLEIAPYFDVIKGSTPEIITKADVIGEVLKETSSEKAVMIGDRIHDIEGAAVYDIPTIIVGWGAAPESERAQAWTIAETPADIETILAEAGL